MSADGCREFERWLDTGDPLAVPEWALAHTRACAECAHRLARARELDILLVDAIPAAAPAGFTDAVLARLDPAPARPRPTMPLWGDPMPWMVQIVMEPAVMLSLALAALCVWQGGRLREVALALAAAFSGATLGRGAAAAHLGVYALALAPLAGVAAVWLYQWGARAGTRGAWPRIARP